MRIKKIIALMLLGGALQASAQHPVRVHLNIDKDWKFAFGDASSPANDFGHGTEYFNYYTKANSIHNEGPYANKFDDSAWKEVDLPHDWVVDLPYAKEASHSHGYKTVGYKYPKTSVGWYRKTILIQPEDLGRRLTLQFDGIFRDSRVWANGFYLGGEPSGYVSRVYDVTDYIDQTRLKSGTPDTLRICVRADATFEEGWFYEGAGIYRHVWLNKTEQLHFAPYGINVEQKLSSDYKQATLTVKAEVENGLVPTQDYNLRIQLLPKDGVGEALFSNSATLTVQNPKLWSPDTPYLYIVRAQLFDKTGKLCDTMDTTIGLRDVRFDANEGLFINGQHVKLHGACMHQDHAGVGAGIPDELQVWRLMQLKKWGFNAYRSSHNPMTPETIAACDSLGILVIEENRLLGTSDYQLTQLERIIRRDRNHPSIIAWSMGNEEWGVEWNPLGTQIVRGMCEFARSIDPTRPMTVATSSGPAPVDGADMAGYNYVTQNPIEERRQQFPNRIAYGSEETTGCGTRGLYWDDAENGRMAALNRTPDKDGTINRIERGWKFYDERPWLLGLFYWTGFDYRGEPNPMVFPATSSEFGILDYCGFPKDEAYYVKAWWTDEPLLHLLPHWNLAGHEGETIDVWAYSNCDEVELFQGSRSLGKKQMPKDGHLAWDVVYKPGKLRAVGYKAGKKVLTETIETTGEAVALTTTEEHVGRLTVVTVEARDAKGRLVPDANVPFTLKVSGHTRILGVGNGDPAWQAIERPVQQNGQTLDVKTFNGLAQLLLLTPNGETPTYYIDK